MRGRRGLFAAIVTAVVLPATVFGANAAATNQAASRVAGLPGLTDRINDVKAFVAALLVALAVALALLLVPYVLARIIRLRRARQLIIANFTDATGDPTLGTPALLGLSQTLREELFTQLDRVGRVARKTIHQAGLLNAPLLPSNVAIRVTPDDTLHALADSVQGLIGDDGSQSAKFVDAALLKSAGINVSLTLQRRGGPVPRIGVTIGIADLRDLGAPQFDTLWDGRDANSFDDLLESHHGIDDSDLQATGHEVHLQAARHLIVRIRRAVRTAAIQAIGRSDEDHAPPLVERYGESIRALALLLSLQLFREELLADQSRRLVLRLSPLDVLSRGWGTTRQRRIWITEGRVRNYISMLLANLAVDFAEDPGPGHYELEFLVRAITEARHASSLNPHDFRSYETLGDAFTFLGESQQRGNAPGSPADRLARRALRRALEEYRHALDVLSKATSKKGGRRLLPTFGDPVSAGDAARARRRIRADMVIAAFRARDPVAIRDAENWLPEAEDGWTSDPDPFFLATLADCRALRAAWRTRRSADHEGDLSMARRFLAFAIARDGIRAMTSPLEDDDLRELFDNRDDRHAFTTFLAMLDEARTAHECLPWLGHEELNRELETITCRADWDMAREEADS